MRNVEGLELSAAINALEADGIQVTTLEVSNSAELTFAVFKTRIGAPEE